MPSLLTAEAEIFNRGFRRGSSRWWGSGTCGDRTWASVWTRGMVATYVEQCAFAPTSRITLRLPQLGPGVKDSALHSSIPAQAACHPVLAVLSLLLALSTVSLTSGSLTSDLYPFAACCPLPAASCCFPQSGLGGRCQRDSLRCHQKSASRGEMYLDTEETAGSPNFRPPASPLRKR